jgi:polysaccharide pyruvyl transferase WcaK-like protein
MSERTEFHPRIVHAHNHGHGNLGDDAMADNIYRKLQAIDPNLHTISTYSAPGQASPDKDVTSLSGVCLDYNSFITKCFLVFCHKFRLKWLRRFYIFLICNLFYFGAVFYKKTGIVTFFSSRKRRLLTVLEKADLYLRSGSGSINDIWYDTAVIIQYYESLVCKLFGGKIVFTGQGIGPLSGWRWDRVVRLSTNADFMTFRDGGVSERLLRAHGVHGSRFRSVGDDAFDIPITPAELQYPDLDTIPKNNKIICIQFRKTDYENTYSVKLWSIIANTLKLINEQVADVYFVFLPMSHGGIDDVKVGEFIESQYGGSNFLIVNRKLNASEVKGIVSASHLAIGQSYHFGVFALSSNVPFIGVYTNEYYKLKNEGLLRWYNREEWGVPLESIEKTAAMAAEIFRGWDERVAELRSANSQIQNRIDDFYGTVLPRLTDGRSAG